MARGLFIATFEITIILIRIIYCNRSKESPCFAQRYQRYIYIYIYTALVDANDAINCSLNQSNAAPHPNPHANAPFRHTVIVILLIFFCGPRPTERIPVITVEVTASPRLQCPLSSPPVQLSSIARALPLPPELAPPLSDLFPCWSWPRTTSPSSPPHPYSQ